MPIPRYRKFFTEYNTMKIWKHEKEEIYYVEGWIYAEFYSLKEATNNIDRHMNKIKKEIFKYQLSEIINDEE